ncbi:salicylate synthase [Pseudonocardia sp. N23]|uniref:salicylate synthase n=1 Tax=Pseudonocardia sp. N23 TaxID=1987376 RepID=UPI000BFB3927|nr:salicylate synthase [Pseudonocardia sp. N23]GAY08790.1 iron acquisition yersiniabactin synthesis enzyme [Pseudonocardia sp. N23]
MTPALDPVRRTVGPVADPLLAAAALARAATGPYVVYEQSRRWTFASGARAELTMDARGIRLRTGSTTVVEPVGDEPLQQVSRLLTTLPFGQWRAVGWAAYELHTVVSGNTAMAGDRPVLHLVVPEREVRLDPAGAELAATDDAGLDALAAALAATAPTRPPGGAIDVAATGGEAYRAAVTAAVRDIRDDRLQKVILSRVVPVPDEIDLVDSYVAGRRGNTPARSFLFDLGGLAATGFSPETVVEVGADGRVSTQPLAGTRALLGDPVADLARRVELLGDPKEIFEHAISVRLAQDELAGVCRADSVFVEEFMNVQERGSVQHLASRVTGRLADGRNAWHALAALFPAITASGIPKAPAFELIAEHEEYPRGLYSGAVLSVGCDGTLDAALVLRTVFSQDGRTWLRAGAGIVAPSTPEREFEETNEKLRSISRFLVPAATHQEGPAQVTGPDLTVEGLRATAAELTEEDAETIAADANLFELGLESIALMQLVASWRRAGVEVNFAELAETPTLDGWSKLLSSRRAEVVVPAPVVPAEPASEDFPLATLQHAYWIGRSPAQRLGGVAAHLYTEFDGADVDAERLATALERLVARHGMLRAVVTDNGRQHIAPASGWRGLTVHDLRSVSDDERERRLEEVRDVNSHQLLDIESGEVFATALSLLPGGRTRLHVDVDMVAADAVSYRIMLSDLAALYSADGDDAAADLPSLEYDYARYRAARPKLRAEARERAAAWWRDRLPTLPGAPELPAAPTPAGVVDRPWSTRSTRRSVVLPAAERSALTDAARVHGLTPAMVVATAFAEMIGAWSSQPRFLLNVPLFDREPVHPDVVHVVGDFTGSVLLEVDLTEELTFVERARRVQARMHADAAHADYTGVEVLRDLTRSSGEQVVAPVVFTSALALGDLFGAAVHEQFGDPVWIISQGPQVVLDAQVTELAGGLLVNWDARVGELADGVVDAMFDAFAALVSRLAHDPGAWTAPVDGLVPQAALGARAAVNDTAAPRSHRRLHEGFFAHAAADPAAVAILGARTLTYGELADEALRIAAALVDRGVTSGDPVAVTLPKGAGQVAAVLGVLAAGGVYVPVDAAQPPARAARIAAVAGYTVVVDESFVPAARPLAAPVDGAEEDLAYVLFTSGSTGEPKGVEVPHRAAMTTIDDLVGRFGIGPADRTLALSGLDFDLSVFDLFAPLSVGGAVVTTPGDDRRDVESWGPTIAEHGVTVLNCVPPLLDMVLASGVPLGESLRLVLLGGDRVGVDLPGRLAAAVPGARFVGLGGTTETAIHSTVCEVVDADVPDDWRCVPYGTPLSNVVCRVVDQLGRDCPDWVPGELWIGGDGVARGYRGDTARTADRFVSHQGRNWYRTGDLARYRGDGTLEFLGRNDNQVKIRGFRVELGEVEAALAAVTGVTGAAAVVAGTSTLAAAVAGAGLDADAVREAVRDTLPSHMVPEEVVVLDVLPLTGNNKIDRKAVRELASQALGREPAAAELARTPVERVIAAVWRDVLGVEQVGVHDEFFAIGGDSVLATSIVAALRDALDTRSVSVRSLFGAPTVAGLAAAMVDAEDEPDRLDAVAHVWLEVAELSDDEVAAMLAGAGE